MIFMTSYVHLAVFVSGKSCAASIQLRPTPELGSLVE